MGGGGLGINPKQGHCKAKDKQIFLFRGGEKKSLKYTCEWES